MIAIAHSPANAVSTLFAEQSSAPPFTPYLTTAPNDFSLGLVFTGGGINLTNGMAVDAMGNVWSASNGRHHHQRQQLRTRNRDIERGRLLIRAKWLIYPGNRPIR